MDEVKRALTERPQLLDELNKLVEPDSLALATLAGSRAYGLAHAGSDLDVRGVYIAKTDKFLGLKLPLEQYASTEPDVVLYEVGKFIRMAVAGNPAVIETLFADPHLYASDAGRMLLAKRSLFLSQSIRARYVGYARSQLVRVERMLNGEEATDRFKDATRSKHLRHVFRLVEQGHELVSTGRLTLKLKDPDLIRERSMLPLGEIQSLFASLVEKLDAVESPLPKYPDLDKINDFLVELRHSF